MAAEDRHQASRLHRPRCQRREASADLHRHRLEGAERCPGGLVPVCGVQSEGRRWHVAYGDGEETKAARDAASGRHPAGEGVLAVAAGTLEVEPQAVDWRFTYIAVGAASGPLHWPPRVRRQCEGQRTPHRSQLTHTPLYHDTTMRLTQRTAP